MKRRPDPGELSPLFRFDLEAAYAAGVSPLVAGVDEAGRGALAGPLVAAAVAFDYACWTAEDYAALAGLDDSKRLRAVERVQLLGEIIPRAAQVTVVSCAAASIDERGLHRCNLQALGEALVALRPSPVVVHVDGFALRECPLAHRPVVRGDARSAAVAAASIVAKVTRDAVMRGLHEIHAAWGFATHVGYATPDHHRAILQYGLCAQHRRSFASVAYRQLELKWAGDGAQSAEPVPNAIS